LMEPRADAKGNASQQRTRRAQDRESVSQALERIRNAARHRKQGTIRMSGVLALARATGVNWPGDASAEANQTGRWSCPVGGQHRRG